MNIPKRTKNKTRPNSVIYLKEVDGKYVWSNKALNDGSYSDLIFYDPRKYKSKMKAELQRLRTNIRKFLHDKFGEEQGEKYYIDIKHS